LRLLYGQQEPQNIAVISPDAASFSVDVSDPVKQGSGLQAYVTYKISCYRMLQYQELSTPMNPYFANDNACFSNFRSFLTEISAGPQHHKSSILAFRLATLAGEPPI
jgi:hypothetical protein